MSNPDPTSLRIIDANLNRAREALRVVEEYARFGLDDVGLSAAAKQARHALADCVPGSIVAALPQQRDIVHDVGRGIEAESEYQRAGPVDVALAAGKRLSEALRSIEEYAKTFDRGFAEAIERIRYRGYELERRLVLYTQAVDRFAHVRLYVIITESLCRGEWLATAEACLRGGADCLQLREKELPDAELLRRATKLAALCRAHGALFIVNDRPDVAALSNAHGVHLGQDDLPIRSARRVMSPTSLIGLSTHTIEQVAAAAAEAPDYIAMGPMFATSTLNAPIAGPATLAAAREQTSLPLVAIGGIDESNLGQVLSAASCAVCVCRSVIAEPDAAEAASRLRAAIGASHPQIRS